MKLFVDWVRSLQFLQRCKSSEKCESAAWVVLGLLILELLCLDKKNIPGRVTVLVGR